MSTFPQPSFAGGEVSPALTGRIDLARYQTSLATCRNFIVQAYGGVTNRPGTIYCGNAMNDNVKEYLVPFKWGDSQNFVLVLGNQKMRIMQNRSFVKDDQGNDLSVTTPWKSEDIFNLHWAQSADVVTVVHEKYPPYQIKRYASDDWRIEPYESINGPFEDINIDETKVMTSSEVEGETTLKTNFDLFTQDDVGREVYFEIQDYSYYKAWQSGTEVDIGDQVVSNSKIYKCVELSGTGKVRTGGTAPDHDNGDAWDGSGRIEGEFSYGAKWRYMCSSIGIAEILSVTDARTAKAQIVERFAETRAAINTKFEDLPVEGASRYGKIKYNGTTYYDRLKITVTRHNLVTGQQVKVSGLKYKKGETVSGTSTVYRLDDNNFLLLNLTPGTYETYEWVCTGGGDNESCGYEWVSHYDTYVSGGVISSTTDAEPAETYKWALSAWCKQNGYPSAVGYFQQRMMFAGSTQYPQTVWMTRTGSYQDFGVELPSFDDDGITVTIAASQVNPVRHILSLRSLLLMTSSSEWSIAASDQAVTPSTINLQVQSYRGSSMLSPITVGNMALVVQGHGSVVRDLGYEWASDSFSGTDLTVMADHLFAGHTLEDWDFAQEPFSTAWCVRNDGVLLGLTYMREHEVFAWHRHDTQGEFESVCVIEENNEDRVYVTVKRTINGVTKRFIECFASREFTDQLDGIFLDSSLSYDGRPTNTKAKTLTGLEHLNGMTVRVIADGAVQPDMEVKDGSVTLNQEALVVHVGLPYVSEIETLRMVGPDASIFGRKAICRSVGILCRDTRSVKAGTEWDQLYEVKMRSNERYGDPIKMRTGWFDLGVSTTWTKDCHICIQQKDPLPITILSLVPNIEVGP